jgi:oxalate decarboxylase/phosphoglucose isomerase-like protein (cupin superfamily)
MTSGIEVDSREDAGDPRGLAFAVPENALAALGGVADVHLMTVRPGAVRGNHFHARKREVLVVLHQDEWELHWSEPGGAPQCRTFRGTGGVSLTVQPGVAHAIRNTGTADLTVAGLSPLPFDADNPDSVTVLLV